MWLAGRECGQLPVHPQGEHRDLCDRTLKNCIMYSSTSNKMQRPEWQAGQILKWPLLTSLLYIRLVSLWWLSQKDSVNWLERWCHECSLSLCDSPKTLWCGPFDEHREKMLRLGKLRLFLDSLEAEFHLWVERSDAQVTWYWCIWRSNVWSWLWRGCADYLMGFFLLWNWLWGASIKLKERWGLWV